MIAWLLAFLLHSSFWLGLAWLFTRLRPQMHPRVRETLWHTALLACLITPTAQALAPQGSSSFWAVSLPSHWFQAEVGAEPETIPAPIAIPADVLRALQAGEITLPERQARPASEAAPLAVAWTQSNILRAVLLAWLFISSALMLRYAGRLAAMRRRISPRDLVETTPERCALDQLSRRAGLARLPRLTESESIGSPLALGFGKRAEICIPTRALHELDHDQFCAMLGHEVAHHMRWDPLRLLGLNLLQAVFFFQPMFRVASRQLHLAAEEQCDAWGASHLEDRLAMARCLTEVAAWVLPQDRRLLVAGMARRRSQLGVRVERLMDDGCSFTARGGNMRAFGSAAVLALAPWLAPSLAPASAAEANPPTQARELAPIEIFALDPVVQGARNLELPAKYEQSLVEIEAALQELEATLQLTVAELGPLASAERYAAALDRMQRSLQMQRSSLTVLRYFFAVIAYGEDLFKAGSPVRTNTNTNPSESDEI
jgi:beta-lactamase regulating signal transducer with metallopeptidase domain